MNPAAAAPLPPNPYNPLAWITGNPEIGEGTWIGAFTLIDGQGGLRIGRGCDISCGAQILTHSTVRRCLTGRAHAAVDRQPTEIGDHCFIGTHAVVLMGAKVGHHSVIAAGAVLREGMEVPPYSLVAGVPARVVRSVKDDVERWKTEAKAGRA
ncbi:MAG: acyltransferase [Verrucomicrobia bacterium]|nr:acyltransferase [Verrucomicrobiota bacterium]